VGQQLWKAIKTVIRLISAASPKAADAGAKVISKLRYKKFMLNFIEVDLS
jgi:hypothetical protein